MHNLQILVSSRRWERKKCKRPPSGCCLGCSHNACMRFDRINTWYNVSKPISLQMLYINSHIKKPSPPKSLDSFLLCPTIDPQLRVDARSGKHNIAPVSADKHQIHLRARIILDLVQKDLGEYFYRDKVCFVTGRLIDFVTGQLVEEGGCPRPIDVKRPEDSPMVVRIHGE